MSNNLQRRLRALESHQEHTSAADDGYAPGCLDPARTVGTDGA
jgi:hypothetical protein